MNARRLPSVGLGLALLFIAPVFPQQAPDPAVTANEALKKATDAKNSSAAALKKADDATKTANDAHTASSQALSTAKDANATATKARATADGIEAIARRAKETADGAKVDAENVSNFVNRFWVLLAAVLVFFMQAGFKCLEVGVSRRRHDPATGVMNLMNWLVLCIFFYFVGYGIMFGRTSSGLVSSDWNWWLRAKTGPVLAQYGLGLEHFLFQLGFAATAATIVDGAIAERTALLPYFFLAIAVASGVYPLFGHWAWNPHGWLKFEWLQPNVNPKALISFHDFAGSTVVHSIGAWIALVAVRMVGPRRFRFAEGNDPRFSTFRPYSVGYAVLGVIMLWFGWWGFNGGSELKYDDQIASIILNTNLAGAAAGIVAYFDALWRGRADNLNAKIIGGVLGGLVAITASCDKVVPWQAVVVGATAAIMHNWAFDFLQLRRIDDVAGAIPVHGACGIWGTLLAGLAVAWPITEDLDRTLRQLLAQVCGIGAAFLAASFLAALILLFIRKYLGIRTSIEEEGEGPANTEPYVGPLRASVRRSGGAWTQFLPWAEFINTERRIAGTSWKEAVRTLQALDALTDKERREFEATFRTRWQFIRQDDTTASLEDVRAMLSSTPFFVNYRSGGGRAAAIAMYDRIEEKYKTQVYCDAAGNLQLHGGQSVWETLQAEVLIHCKVFIVIVGPHWRDELARKLAAGETDYVSLEIIWAIRHSRFIIPVFVDGAKRSEQFKDLPDELRVLNDPRSIEIRDPLNRLPPDSGWDELFKAIVKMVPEPINFKPHNWLTRFLELSIGYPWKGFMKDAIDALLYPKHLTR